jgi:hypothetical protein
MNFSNAHLPPRNQLCDQKRTRLSELVRGAELNANLDFNTLDR